MSIKKILLSCTVALAIGLGAGYYIRPKIDPDFISATDLLSEESPVVVIPKENLGKFLLYVEQLKRAFEQCQTNKSL